jgi:hypothetical protein
MPVKLMRDHTVKRSLEKSGSEVQIAVRPVTLTGCDVGWEDTQRSGTVRVSGVVPSVHVRHRAALFTFGSEHLHAIFVDRD